MTYYDLGTYTRNITTSSDDAQRWFDRGLIWTYSYNHEVAVDCFQKALEHDSDCAMAHWGVAYAIGPNYNFEWWMMDPDTLTNSLGTAYVSTQAALALVDTVTPPERALIEALPARYPQRDPIEDQAPWNNDFAAAMKSAYETHPDDIEVATIYAEAILNQTPWKMWDIRNNTVAESAGTVEAQKVLERFVDTPEGRSHPGILHLYVHLMEMSPTPEKALVAGDFLRELVPDAGHLIHMPTHIDIQCGEYRDSLHWNQKGIEADLKIAEREGRMNFYTAYRVHNYHFAIYGAMFLGQYEPAIAAANEMITEIPVELLKQESPPMADFIESYISMKTMCRSVSAAGATSLPSRYPKIRAFTATPLPRSTTPNRWPTPHWVRSNSRKPNARSSLRRAPKCRIHVISTMSSAWTCLMLPNRCWKASWSTERRTTTPPLPISTRRSSWKTRCPMTSRGAGYNRFAMRSALWRWNRAGWTRPNRPIARISVLPANFRVPASIRTIFGASRASTNAFVAAGLATRPRGG